MLSSFCRSTKKLNNMTFIKTWSVVRPSNNSISDIFTQFKLSLLKPIFDNNAPGYVEISRLFQQIFQQRDEKSRMKRDIQNDGGNKENLSLNYLGAKYMPRRELRQYFYLLVQLQVYHQILNVKSCPFSGRILKFSFFTPEWQCTVKMADELFR